MSCKLRWNAQDALPRLLALPGLDELLTSARTRSQSPRSGSSIVGFTSRST